MILKIEFPIINAKEMETSLYNRKYPNFLPRFPPKSGNFLSVILIGLFYSEYADHKKAPISGACFKFTIKVVSNKAMPLLNK